MIKLLKYKNSHYWAQPMEEKHPRAMTVTDNSAIDFISADHYLNCLPAIIQVDSAWSKAVFLRCGRVVNEGGAKEPQSSHECMIKVAPYLAHLINTGVVRARDLNDAEDADRFKFEDGILVEIKALALAS